MAQRSRHHTRNSAEYQSPLSLRRPRRFPTFEPADAGSRIGTSLSGRTPVLNTPTIHSTGTLQMMLRLALPVLAEESLNLLIGYTDWWLTSRYLPGEAYQAAMGLMAYITWLIPCWFAAAAIGATAADLASGRRRPEAGSFPRDEPGAADRRRAGHRGHVGSLVRRSGLYRLPAVARHIGRPGGPLSGDPAAGDPADHGRAGRVRLPAGRRGYGGGIPGQNGRGAHQSRGQYDAGAGAGRRCLGWAGKGWPSAPLAATASPG